MADRVVAAVGQGSGCLAEICMARFTVRDGGDELAVEQPDGDWRCELRRKREQGRGYLTSMVAGAGVAGERAGGDRGRRGLVCVRACVREWAVVREKKELTGGARWSTSGRERGGARAGWAG